MKDHKVFRAFANTCKTSRSPKLMVFLPLFHIKLWLTLRRSRREFLKLFVCSFLEIIRCWRWWQQRSLWGLKCTWARKLISGWKFDYFQPSAYDKIENCKLGQSALRDTGSINLIGSLQITSEREAPCSRLRLNGTRTWLPGLRRLLVWNGATDSCSFSRIPLLLVLGADIRTALCY